MKRRYAGAVPPRHLSTILAATAAAVALGACGGDGDRNGAADVKIETKADYIEAGDTICRDRDARSLTLAKGSAKGANVAVLTGKLADIYADTISRQQALELPKGPDRAGAQSYVKSITAMTRPVQRMKASAGVLAKATGEAAVKSAAATLQANVNTVQAIGDAADQQARTYGFRVCGQQQAADPVS